jgi:hypothetical protein
MQQHVMRVTSLVERCAVRVSDSVRCEQCAAGDWLVTGDR